MTTEPVTIREISDALGSGDHESVSLVGGGGKTTVLFALGTQLGGTVVLTTTTDHGEQRSICYLRVSTDEQAASGLGFAPQQECATAYAVSQG